MVNFNEMRKSKVNFIRKNFRVVFLTETYKKYEPKGEVSCTLAFKIVTPFTVLKSSTSKLPETLLDIKEFPVTRVTGTSKCSKNDKFDLSKGKRIAKTKAENKAYDIAMDYADRLLRELALLASATTNFHKASDTYINHNMGYIKEVDAEDITSTKEVLEGTNHKPVTSKSNHQYYFNGKEVSHDEFTKLKKEFDNHFESFLDNFFRVF